MITMGKSIRHIWINKCYVGIGGQVDRDELAAMASKPTDKFMSLIDSFDVLDEIKGQLAVKACEGTHSIVRV